MKKLIVLLVLVGILIAGCSTGTRLRGFEPDINRFRQMENAIGCIGAYNYNRLNSLHIPLPTPQTQQEYQIYKKFGGYYMK